MGLHTWFHKDRELYKQRKELYEQLDKHDNGEIYLDDLEISQIVHKIDQIYKQNDSKYHDLFRTNKREPDGCYTLDVIYSKEECEKWLSENSNLVHHLNRKFLDQFWTEYPNGVIDFG